MVCSSKKFLTNMNLITWNSMRPPVGFSLKRRDGRTYGHTLLQRCGIASKNLREQIYKTQPIDATGGGHLPYLGLSLTSLFPFIHDFHSKLIFILTLFSFKGPARCLAACNCTACSRRAGAARRGSPPPQPPPASPPRLRLVACSWQRRRAGAQPWHRPDRTWRREFFVHSR